MKEATITNVSYENGIILLAVQLENGDTLYPVAFGKQSSEITFAPREGDVVAVDRTDEGRDIAPCVISRSQIESPEIAGGEFAFQLNENSVISASENEDGNFDVTINIDGNVTINAEGDIKIGEDGVAVAKEDHTHNYNWGDSGGSGTTDTPNEEGTETTIK